MVVELFESNPVKIRIDRSDLRLTHRWRIASGHGSRSAGGRDLYSVVFVELEDVDGVVGRGEAAPSTRYGESAASAVDFLNRLDPDSLSFADIPASMEYLERIGPGNFSAKTAINIALLDGAGQRAGKPVFDLLELGFTEDRHVTSFSLGIDEPEAIEAKTREAGDYPVLKLKMGGSTDRETLAAVRRIAPTKKLRIDANEGWRDRDEALARIEWLAEDGNIEFVEQPMPASTDPKHSAWLRDRSPLPVMADESCRSAADIAMCADCFHSVNVKLMKTGGMTEALETLRAARRAGLKTMLGCMIESSIAITAAAHLAELTDYLDLDGNLLITNDPWAGVRTVKGVLSFREPARSTGLCVARR